MPAKSTDNKLYSIQKIMALSLLRWSMDKSNCALLDALIAPAQLVYLVLLPIVQQQAADLALLAVQLAHQMLPLVLDV